VTTAFDARPQGIVVVAGSSFMPFALAATLTIVSAALLFEVYWAGLVFSVVSVPLVIRWLWPSRDERDFAGAGRSLDDADLPVHATGTASTAWWGMVLTLVALAATLALLVYSYFYLAYAGPDRASVEPPPSGLALASVAVLLTSVVPLLRALGAIRRGEGFALRGGLATALGLGLAYVAIAALDLLGQGLEPARRASDAMFATFAAYQILIAVIGLAAIAFVLAQAWLGFFDRRRHVAIENVALLWSFVAVSGAVTVATLYLSPHLL
jgi:cytochrome c oxidase subunit I+III